MSGKTSSDCRLPQTGHHQSAPALGNPCACLRNPFSRSIMLSTAIASFGRNLNDAAMTGGGAQSVSSFVRHVRGRGCRRGSVGRLALSSGYTFASREGGSDDRSGEGRGSNGAKGPDVVVGSGLGCRYRRAVVGRHCSGSPHRQRTRRSILTVATTGSDRGNCRSELVQDARSRPHPGQPERHPSSSSRVSIASLATPTSSKPRLTGLRIRSATGRGPHGDQRHWQRQRHPHSRRTGCRSPGSP